MDEIIEPLFDFPCSSTFREYEREIQGLPTRSPVARFPDAEKYSERFSISESTWFEKPLENVKPKEKPMTYNELSQKYYSLAHFQERLMQRLDKVEKGGKRHDTI